MKEMLITGSGPALLHDDALQKGSESPAQAIEFSSMLALDGDSREKVTQNQLDSEDELNSSESSTDAVPVFAAQGQESSALRGLAPESATGTQFGWQKLPPESEKLPLSAIDISLREALPVHGRVAATSLPPSASAGSIGAQPILADLSQNESAVAIPGKTGLDGPGVRSAVTGDLTNQPFLSAPITGRAESAADETPGTGLQQLPVNGSGLHRRTAMVMETRVATLDEHLHRVGEPLKIDTVATDRPQRLAEQLSLSSRFMADVDASQMVRTGAPESVNKVIREAGMQGLLHGQPGETWLSSGDTGRTLVSQGFRSLETVPAAPLPELRSGQLAMAPNGANVSEPILGSTNAPVAAQLTSTGSTPDAVLRTPFTGETVQNWVSEMREKLDIALVNQRREIEIKLTPAHLGKLEVLIQKDGEQTSLTFFSKNPEAREVLEQGLSRLQRSFADEGLNLGQSTVSDQSMAEHREAESSPDADTEADHLLNSERSERKPADREDILSGLVNTWA